MILICKRIHKPHTTRPATATLTPEYDKVTQKYLLPHTDCTDNTDLFLLTKTKKTPISVCKCLQPFYDARQLFLLVSEFPDKNINLTS